MSHGVNLIPLHRRRAKARRARTRAWFAIGGTYAVVLTIAAVALTFASSSTCVPAKDLRKAESEIERSNQQLTAVRTVLAEAQQTLASARAVSDQPDWSMLLVLLAKSTGDDVVLNRCEITPVKDDAAPTIPGAPPPAPPVAPPVQTVGLTPKAAVSRSAGRADLRLAGIGRSQAAVAQFVLQLESTDLFEHVSLLQTTRQEYLGGEAVAFELDCPLRGRTTSGGGLP
jgi:Tfp pilus assembly protein PilN